MKNLLVSYEIIPYGLSTFCDKKFQDSDIPPPHLFCQGYTPLSTHILSMQGYQNVIYGFLDSNDKIHYRHVVLFLNFFSPAAAKVSYLFIPEKFVVHSLARFRVVFNEYLTYALYIFEKLFWVFSWKTINHSPNCYEQLKKNLLKNKTRVFAHLLDF